MIPLSLKRISLLLFTLAIAGGLFFALPAFAQETPLGAEDFFGSAQTGEEFAAEAGLGQANLVRTIANIIRIFLGFTGVVLVMVILYGGFMWMTAGGNDDRVKKAKQTITNGVIGLVIALSSFAIAQFVISQLVGATGGGSSAGGPPGGGGFYGDGGPGAGSFYLASLNDECAPALQNLELQFIFSQNVSPSTVDAGGITVVKEGGEPVDGAFSVSGKRVSFLPNAVCAEDPNERCFESGVTYEASVLSSTLRSVGGRTIDCSINNPCSFIFTVGEGIDTSAPSLSMDAPEEGASVIVGDIELLQSLAEDDVGVSSVNFIVESAEVYNAGIEQSTAGALDPSNFFFTDVAQEWDTAGFVTNRNYDIWSSGLDCAGNFDVSPQTSIVLRAPNCANGVQDTDLGETGVDCGGDAGSELYCGSCAGSSCDSNADCSTGVCQAGVCVSVPQIDSVSPGDGAPGNLITIFGKGFGAAPGSVTFLGTENGDQVTVNAYECNATTQWLDGQIVIQVDGSAVDGPISVNTATGDVDRTDDAFGTNITNFDVNDVERPGICMATPSAGEGGSQVTLTGVNFGDSQGSGTVYFENYEASSYSGWASTDISPVVPLLNARNYKVKTFVGDNVCAISGAFCNSDLDCTDEPDDACVFGREGSNAVGYRVVSSGAGAPPVLNVIDTGWKACSGGDNNGAVCGQDTDCPGGGACTSQTNWGPPDQYVTLYGSNFGTAEGTVRFVNVARGDAEGLALASTSFPAVCSPDFWHPNSITVKVPETYASGALAEPGAYEVFVQRQDGQVTERLDFVLLDDEPGPSMCSIEPSAGPIGTQVSIFGENFGSLHGAINFYNGSSISASVVDIASVAWSADKLSSVAVPDTAVTGPVAVSNSVGYSSNPVNFEVGDCREDAGICTEGKQCCSDGTCRDSCPVSVADSYYAFSFSTGPLSLTPRVLVQCNDVALSPSPWIGWSQPESVCLDAAVTATFSIDMNTDTFFQNVRVERCIGTGENPCAGQGALESVSGGIDPTLVSARTFHWEPEEPFVENSTYLVTLEADGILSAYISATEPGEPMDEDFSWTFTTAGADTLCEIGDVYLNPDEETATEAGQEISYLAQPIAANDRCVVLSCQGKTVEWDSDYSGAVLTGIDADDDGTPETFNSCANIVRAEEETQSGRDAEITAMFPKSTNNPSDTGLLEINFLDPEVSSYSPSCDTACVNAAIQIGFNTNMLASTLVAGNMTLSSCTNALCLENLTAKSVSNTNISCKDTTPDPLGETCRLVQIDFDLGDELEANTYYKMVLSGDAILSSSLVPLSRAGANDGQNFSWIFRTKNDDVSCSIDRISVLPATARLIHAGERQEFIASAFGAVDDCSVNGQLLSSRNFSWSPPWSAVDAIDIDPTVDVAFMLEGGAISLATELPNFCTNACLNAGAPVTTADPICGNGDVEFGEDCDDENDQSGDGCSSTCRLEGLAACSSTCALSGNACTSSANCTEVCQTVVCADVADAGEACTDGSTCDSGTCDEGECAGAADAGDACGANAECSSGSCGGTCSISGDACSGEDSTCPYATDTCTVSGTQCCGNGEIESREECDVLGNVESGDGCSSICTNEGSTLKGSVCGNGLREWLPTLGGEECDDGNRRSGDGCSSTCLNEGSTPKSLAYAICGDGVRQNGEDCDDGNFANGDGCSSRCLNEGTLQCVRECRDSKKSCSTAADCNTSVSEPCMIVNGPCCGNGGVLDFGEDCDDGNSKNRDGCSSSCLNEGASAYYATASYCGDGGVPGLGEECEAESDAPSAAGPYGIAQVTDFVAREVDPVSKEATSVISAYSTGVVGEAELVVECSCETDLACGAPSSLGCGNTGCCYGRPNTGPATPQYDWRACRNTAVAVEFTQIIDESTLDETVDENGDGLITGGEYRPNLYLELFGSASNCPTDENHLLISFKDPNQGWFARLWTGVKYRVQKFFGMDAHAGVPLRACLMRVDYEVKTTPGGGSKVYLRYPDLLEEDRIYLLQVATDPNIYDGNPEGVLSRNGVGLSGNITGIKTISRFRTTSEICELDRVTIEDEGNIESFTDELIDPSPTLFTTTGEAHGIQVTPYTILEGSNELEEISPIQGVYEWTLGYGSNHPEIVSLSASGIADYEAVASAGGEEGRATLVASAQFTANTFSPDTQPVGSSVTGHLNVSALLCENPWPPITPAGNWPFTDKYNVSSNELGLNFSFHYCRDAGEEGVAGDLPAISDVEVPAPLSGIFREFLFIVDGTGDAFGVRAVANDQYLDPLSWYAAQGFTGSPTRTLVDGYDAIVEGNTAYVAAPNQTGDIYPNIYVLSFNADAGDASEDIFGQVLENWRFNANTDDVSDVNICRVDNNSDGTWDAYIQDAEGNFVSCSFDTQCEESCLGGVCSVTGTECSTNADCALASGVTSECDAEKAKLTRDMRRLSDITLIRRTLEDWGEVNGHCSVTKSQACTVDAQCPGAELCLPSVPAIAEGSFIRATTNSVWPSWNSVLGNTLGTSLPIDPLNAFVSCANPFDPTTCFDAASGTFQCQEGSQAYGFRSFGEERFTLSAQLEYNQAPWFFAIDANEGDYAEIVVDIPNYAGTALPAGFNATSSFCDGRVLGNSEACGDGIVGVSEVCEIGSVDSASCTVCAGPSGTLGAQSCSIGSNAGCNIAAGEVCVGGLKNIACFRNADNQCEWETAATSVSQCSPYQCGNGIVEASEDCDDGILNGSYGHCSQDCTLSGRFYCGDGYLAGGEQCDCGNAQSGALSDPESWASANCTGNNGQYSASYEMSCAFDCSFPGPSCGDGEVNGAEVCDGQFEEWGGALCADLTSCTSDTDCTDGSSCGSGALACGSSRVCTGGGTGSDDGDSCTSDASCDGTCGAQVYELTRTRSCSTCAWGGWSECSGGDQVCGNNIQEGNEACDDGNQNNQDSCLNTCEINVCGDGFVYSGVESCDDAERNGQACEAGYGGICQSCTNSCRLQSQSGAFCGDGIINGTELCDGSAQTYTCTDVQTGRAVLQGNDCLSGDEGNVCGNAERTCRFLGVCNGGQDNGTTCTINPATGLQYGTGFNIDDNTIGCRGGECVVPRCGDNCNTSCPVNFETTSLLAQTSAAGSSQSEAIKLFSYRSGFSPDSAFLYIPQCTVATGFTADVDKSGIVPPSVAVVFVTDHSNSMGHCVDGSANCYGTNRQRIDYVRESTLSAINDLFDSYDAIGGDMQIGLISFAGPDDDTDVEENDDGFNNDSGGLRRAEDRGYLETALATYDCADGGGICYQWTPGYMGMHRARTMLNNSGAEIKILVFLSDGNVTHGENWVDCMGDGRDGDNSVAKIQLEDGWASTIENPTEWCIAEMKQKIIDRARNEDIQFYSAAIVGEGKRSHGWISHLSSNNCGTVWRNENDCPSSDKNYAFQADNASEIGKMYESIVNDILGGVFNFITDVEGVTTFTNGDIREGNAQELPFPSGFECTGSSFTMPLNVVFDGEGQITLSDFEFTYCPSGVGPGTVFPAVSEPEVGSEADLETGPQCGNSIIEEGEWCDGSALPVYCFQTAVNPANRSATFCANSEADCTCVGDASIIERSGNELGTCGFQSFYDDPQSSENVYFYGAPCVIGSNNSSEWCGFDGATCVPDQCFGNCSSSSLGEEYVPLRF